MLAFAETPAPLNTQLTQPMRLALLVMYKEGPLYQFRHGWDRHPSKGYGGFSPQTIAGLELRGLIGKPGEAVLDGHKHRRVTLTTKGAWYARTLASEASRG